MSEVRVHPWLTRYAAGDAGRGAGDCRGGDTGHVDEGRNGFPRLPTSDGYLMVTYPWFRDFASDWDKFLEHGIGWRGWPLGCSPSDWSLSCIAGSPASQSAGSRSPCCWE